MSEKLVYLKCEWCEQEWHEGDPDGDWFSYIPEFDEEGEGHQFCGMPCLLAWL